MKKREKIKDKLKVWSPHNVGDCDINGEKERTLLYPAWVLEEATAWEPAGAGVSKKGDSASITTFWSPQARWRQEGIDPSRIPLPSAFSSASTETACSDGAG